MLISFTLDGENYSLTASVLAEQQNEYSEDARYFPLIIESQDWKILSDGNIIVDFTDYFALIRISNLEEKGWCDDSESIKILHLSL